MRHGFALAACVLMLTACDGDTEGGRVAEPSTPSRTSTSPAMAPTTQAGSDQVCGGSRSEPRARPSQVLVFFGCDTSPEQRLHVFPRPVDVKAGVERRLETAMRAYFRGPTPAEGTDLYAFGPDGTLNSVRVTGNRAIIDLNMDGGLGSTSAQSMAVWEHLEGLAFQFREIDIMEPRYNGSCESFGMAVGAGECLVATRTGIVRPDQL